MKQVTFWILLFLLILPFRLHAETFLGAPVLQDGQVIGKSNSRIEILYDSPPKKIVAEYSRIFKSDKEAKFKKRDDSVLIEDHGAREWHSIHIEGKDGKTQVTIIRDSWTWILGTLVLRFFGVFAVLVVLYAAMALSGAIIRRVVKVEEPAKSK